MPFRCRLPNSKEVSSSNYSSHQVKMKIVHIHLVLLLLYISTCSGTLDHTNLDLLNFAYFKYPNQGAHPKQNSVHPLLQPITDKIQKGKAVLVYFKNLVFGSPLNNEEQVIEFDPHFGKAWQPHYQRHFGYRGEYLIDALGKGYSPQQLHEYGAY